MEDDEGKPRRGAAFSHGLGGCAPRNAEARILVAAVELLFRKQKDAAVRILRAYEASFGRPTEMDEDLAIAAYQHQLRKELRDIEARCKTRSRRGRPPTWTPEKHAQLLQDFEAESGRLTRPEGASERQIAQRLLQKQPWSELLENAKDPVGALTRQLREARDERETAQLEARLHEAEQTDPRRLRENTE
jgi:hypothetical protein